MRLNVRRMSDGDKGFVVCLHGITQHGGVFGDFAELLGDRYATVALDLRGHGASRQEPPWNIDTHVGDVLETTRALGIDRAVWIGHSFGALVVAAVAAQHADPGKIAGIFGRQRFGLVANREDRRRRPA